MEKDKKSLASFENKPEFQKSIADFTVHILRNELALLETQVQAKSSKFPVAQHVSFSITFIL